MRLVTRSLARNTGIAIAAASVVAVVVSFWAVTWYRPGTVVVSLRDGMFDAHNAAAYARPGWTALGLWKDSPRARTFAVWPSNGRWVWSWQTRGMMVASAAGARTGGGIAGGGIAGGGGAGGGGAGALVPMVHTNWAVQTPLWAPFALGVCLWWASRWLPAKRKPGQCVRCGYNCAGKRGACPECGTAV